MTAQDVLDRLTQAGITVTVEGDKIRCRSSAAIPPALGALVATRKHELIKLLEQPPARPEFGKPAPGKPGAPLAPLKPAPWLHQGPSFVRMPAPAHGEDATHEASLERRAEYFRARWRGIDPEGRLVQLPTGTCLVCGCHPIATRGDYRCALCVEAAATVLEERIRSRDAMRSDVEAVFGQHPTTQVSDFDAFKALCGRRWGDLSSDERMERSLEFLADTIEFYIEAGSKSGEARARAVWDRLEAICERRRATP